MRVLLVLKKFDFGGTENHVCDLANYLVKFGHQVYILADTGRQLDRVDSKVIFIPFRLRDHFFPINMLYIIYLIRKYKIDLVHAHQRIAIFYCSLARKIVKFPLVVTMHGRTSNDLPTKVSRTTPDRIIFVSHHIYQKVIAKKIFEKKSVYIPNGVDFRSKNHEPNPFSITYISRVDNNHSLIILMFIRNVLPLLLENYHEVTFNVIGDGNGLKQVENEAEILNARMNRRVCNILGFQPEVKNFICKSSIVLGVGRVAIESIACGTPVLSLNQKRLGSVITTQNYQKYKHSNFVNTEGDKPDVDRIYLILNDFFKNIDEYNLDVKEVQGMIRNDFDIESLARSIEGLYYELYQEYK